MHLWAPSSYKQENRNPDRFSNLPRATEMNSLSLELLWGFLISPPVYHRAGCGRPFQPFTYVSSYSAFGLITCREGDRTHLEVTLGFGGSQSKGEFPLLWITFCTLSKDGTSADWAWRTLALFTVFYSHVLKIRRKQEIWPHEHVPCCIWTVQIAKIEEHGPVNSGPNLFINKGDRMMKPSVAFAFIAWHRHSLNLMSVSSLTWQQQCY